MIEKQCSLHSIRKSVNHFYSIWIYRECLAWPCIKHISSKLHFADYSNNTCQPLEKVKVAKDLCWKHLVLFCCFCKWNFAFEYEELLFPIIKGHKVRNRHSLGLTLSGWQYKELCVCHLHLFRKDIRHLWIVLLSQSL